MRKRRAGQESAQLGDLCSGAEPVEPERRVTMWPRWAEYPGMPIRAWSERSVFAVVYQVLAQAAMAAHFLFLAYVVVGGFLAWRWPKAWFPHAGAAAWGAGIVVFEWHCPLTHVENYMRDAAGREGLHPGGFMDEYVAGVVYPEDRLELARAVVAAVVAISWAGALWRMQTRRREGQSQSPAAQPPSDRTVG